ERGELDAPIGVVAVDGVQEPDQGRLDQVVLGLAVVAELAGQRDGEAGVLLDQFGTQARVAGAVAKRHVLGDQLRSCGGQTVLPLADEKRSPGPPGGRSYRRRPPPRWPVTRPSHTLCLTATLRAGPWVSAVPGEAGPCVHDQALGLDGVHPALDLGVLVRFEGLVDLEEVSDLVQQRRAHVLQAADVVPPVVRRRSAQHLGVAARLVDHEEGGDGAGVDVAARERGLVHQHQGVERVAVLTERVGDEAVVGRVLGRREEHAVEPDGTALVVHLVLVARSAGDLDDDLDFHRGGRYPRPRASAPVIRLAGDQAGSRPWRRMERTNHTAHAATVPRLRAHDTSVLAMRYTLTGWLISSHTVMVALTTCTNAHSSVMRLKKACTRGWLASASGIGQKSETSRCARGRPAGTEIRNAAPTARVPRVGCRK